MTLFDLPAPLTIPVEGEDAHYPVGRIFCVGRNYAAHAAEMGFEVDREKPFYFTKSVANAVASGAHVPYPQGTSNYHFEMEFAIAMGEAGAVFGYCCALDMTRRDLQKSERAKQRPWSLGKDVENSAVFAPITKAADFGVVGPQAITLNQNGERRQEAVLSDLVWSVEEIIAHLSGFYHLRPGDMIMTGTPAGVGPVASGDVLRGSIDGLEPISLAITD